MSDHLTEEEQLENLKRLWKEYGTTIIASVAVATAGYFGWNYWQSAEQQRIAQASDTYEEIVASASGPAAGEESAATTEHLAAQIKDSADDTAYAAQAAFFAAKAAVQNDNLDQAQQQLQWVIDNSKTEAFQEIARMRLARVLAAKGEYDSALQLVSAAPAVGFAAEQAEVRGDILRMSGDQASAYSAYQEALENFDGDQQRRLVLQMKADDMKPANAEEPSA
ncbi:tetratricopeptide repeat protein [Gilvimarinus sp. DA14]|uniref:YfgM family protein n=1 Tax=Gilvimarinus sp. DA14 TaxID=2956798 RepID=UPI0020B84586|nr:tetratricopeptide repeat protein [Gilvimarinus sp. DA14]UTF60862.1 tetratricopeptide repeat protein [Gilvimarinus sp. DA14]